MWAQTRTRFHWQERGDRSVGRSYGCYTMIIIIILSVFAVLTGLYPAIAVADGLNGFLEWGYTGIDTRSRSAAGETNTARWTNFNQRYSLSLDKRLFPNVRLMSSGIFEKNLGQMTDSNGSSNSAVTTMRPSLDLSLNTLLYTAGLGYSRRDETTKATGVAGTTAINEDWHGMLGWRPVGLPRTDLQLSRTNSFDSTRLLNDATTDRALLGLKYSPSKTVDLTFQSVYTDALDRLLDFETRTLNNSGRISYTDKFLNKRIAVTTNYSVNRLDTTVISGTDGEVPYQLFPFSGLYAASDVPTVVALAANPALINGDTGVAAGIDSLGVPAPSSEGRPRNIGLDFINPVEINTLQIFIDRDLPPAISSLFAWDIYKTDDDPANGNPRWELVQIAARATFGPLLGGHRFQVQFPTVTARAIKVVVNPLTAIAASRVPDFQERERILVTEMQGYIRRPVAQVNRDSSSLSQILNLDVKARLLNKLPLFYDSSMLLKTSGSGVRSTFSNGLSLDHRFNDVFSSSARIAREDDDAVDGHRVGYLYTVSLKATPLKTLSHNLVYSGRYELLSGGTRDTNSIYLHNHADLYRGISVNLSGGATYVTTEHGSTDADYSAVFAANIVPHRSLSMNLNYTVNKAVTSLLMAQNQNSFQQRAELNASFRPFPAIYLFGSLGVVEQNAVVDTLMNYGLNWSPFPDGAIQFGFGYNETMRSLERSKERLISPNLSWKVTSKSLLDLSYSFTSSTSREHSLDSKIFNATYRIFF